MPYKSVLELRDYLLPQKSGDKDKSLTKQKPVNATALNNQFSNNLSTGAVPDHVGETPAADCQIQMPGPAVRAPLLQQQHSVHQG